LTQHLRHLKRRDAVLSGEVFYFWLNVLKILKVWKKEKSYVEYSSRIDSRSCHGILSMDDERVERLAILDFSPWNWSAPRFNFEDEG
jgi:hypothetical protein